MNGFQLFDALPRLVEDALRAKSNRGRLVYFIQSDDGRVKIGFARQPSQRLKELQTGSPRRLRLVGLALGGPATERHLHRLFSDFRIAGEWFHPHELVIEAIRQGRWEAGAAA